jgi:hypothetical protein
VGDPNKKGRIPTLKMAMSAMADLNSSAQGIAKRLGLFLLLLSTNTLMEIGVPYKIKKTIK